MAIAIPAAVVGLLVVGLVVAVSAAARARRKFPLAFKPAPWSSDELDGLSSDLTDLGGPDPIAAFARADSATHRGRSEPKPVTSAAGRADVGPGRHPDGRCACHRPPGRRGIPRNWDDFNVAATREPKK